MNFLLLLLQAQLPQELQTEAAKAVVNTTTAASQNYFSLLMKGGWIMYPIILLSILAVYFICERFISVSNVGKIDKNLTYQICERVSKGDIESAFRTAQMSNSCSARVILAGLNAIDYKDSVIEDVMKTESQNQVFRMETNMSSLGIIASIAPMMGFLGTIFGVIKIFYNIATTEDLSISSISEGLYEKMICSGAGLVVGIIAYTGYQILNRRIDKAIHKMDESSNEVLMAIRYFKKDIK